MHLFRGNFCTELRNGWVGLTRDKDPLQIMPTNPANNRRDHFKHLWNGSQIHRQKNANIVVAQEATNNDKDTE